MYCYIPTGRSKLLIYFWVTYEYSIILENFLLRETEFYNEYWSWLVNSYRCSGRVYCVHLQVSTSLRILSFLGTLYPEDEFKKLLQNFRNSSYLTTIIVSCPRILLYSLMPLWWYQISQLVETFLTKIIICFCVTVTMLEWHCYSDTVTVTLLQWHCYSDTVRVTQLQWHC